MGAILIVILRWLLVRWIYVLPTILFAAYSGWVWHKAENHGETKVNTEINTATKRIKNVWEKIDAAPDDTGIALRRLRQRSGSN